MSDYQVMIDRNAYTYLQYRDAGKTRHFVTMRDGTIDTIQIQKGEFSQLKPLSCTPEHFAQKYLNSYLTISRSARAILHGVLGQSESPQPVAERASFSGGTVSLAQILEGTGIELSVARKYLRKLIEKPSGRWEWPPEEAERVLSMVQEMRK